MTSIELRELSKTHFITIDCSPITKIKRDQIIQTILRDTGLSFEDFEIVSKVWGEWKYDLYKDKEPIYNTKIEQIIGYIKQAYNNRIIRAAKWYEM